MEVRVCACVARGLVEGRYSLNSSPLKARRAFFLAGTSLLLAATSATAFAQDTAPTSGDPIAATDEATAGQQAATAAQQQDQAIIVTGIRRGIQT